MKINKPTILNDRLVSDILNLKQNKPLLISIAGGSATGKTSVVSKRLFNLFTKIPSVNPLIINQDDFQIGRPFVNSHKSKYKWDDPRNFDLPTCTTALKELIETNKTTIPIFSVHETQRVGSQPLEVNSNSVIIFEGLYTFLEDELSDMADYKIFVQSHFYARLLRRIFRFVYELKIPDFDVALRQMILKVQLANKEQVSLQRRKSNLMIHTPYSFTETFERFDLKNKQPFEHPAEQKVISFQLETELEVQITLGKENSYFNLIYKNENYYRTLIGDEVIKALSETDPYSFD